jgi:hypothetical protein
MAMGVFKIVFQPTFRQNKEPEEEGVHVDPRGLWED